MKAFTMASFVVFGKPSHNIKKQIHVHGFPRNAASHQTYLNSTNALFTMEPKETLEHLKESNTFRQWNEKNTDNFFSYALKIIEKITLLLQVCNNKNVRWYSAGCVSFSNEWPP